MSNLFTLDNKDNKKKKTGGFIERDADEVEIMGVKISTDTKIKNQGVKKNSKMDVWGEGDVIKSMAKNTEEDRPSHIKKTGGRFKNTKTKGGTNWNTNLGENTGTTAEVTTWKGSGRWVEDDHTKKEGVSAWDTEPVNKPVDTMVSTGPVQNKFKAKGKINFSNMNEQRKDEEEKKKLRLKAKMDMLERQDKEEQAARILKQVEAKKDLERRTEEDEIKKEIERKEKEVQWDNKKKSVAQKWNAKQVPLVKSEKTEVEIEMERQKAIREKKMKEEETKRTTKKFNTKKDFTRKTENKKVKKSKKTSGVNTKKKSVVEDTTVKRKSTLKKWGPTKW